MADRTVNGLQACMSSLAMTIGPCAAQADDTLAREQVALMTKYLSFISQRVHLIGDRVRFELCCYLDMAEGAAEARHRHGLDAAALARLCGEARQRLASMGARQVELEAISAALRTEVSRTVRALPPESRAARQDVEAVVIACSRALIEFQRAWFAPQAWETHTEQLPDVETLLATASR